MILGLSIVVLLTVAVALLTFFAPSETSARFYGTDSSFLENFSLTAYRPMLRLATQMDRKFLSTAHGEVLANCYRKIQRNLLREYLHEASKDFNRLYSIANAKTLHATSDPDGLSTASVRTANDVHSAGLGNRSPTAAGQFHAVCRRSQAADRAARRAGAADAPAGPSAIQLSGVLSAAGFSRDIILEARPPHALLAIDDNRVRRFETQRSAKRIPITHGPPAGRAGDDARRGGGFLFLRPASDRRAARSAEPDHRTQSQGFAATAAHSERPERARSGHARHAERRRALSALRLECAVRPHPQGHQ